MMRMNSAFADLVPMKRWIAYKLEPNAKTGKPDKVPYVARANGMTLHKAEMQRAGDLADLAGHQQQAMRAHPDLKGAEIALGAINADYYLIGINVNSCFDPAGAPAAWAAPVFQVLEPTYIEFSPSGTGAHALFYLAARPTWQRSATCSHCGATIGVANLPLAAARIRPRWRSAPNGIS